MGYQTGNISFYYIGWYQQTALWSILDSLLNIGMQVIDVDEEQGRDKESHLHLFINMIDSCLLSLPQTATSTFTQLLSSE